MFVSCFSGVRFVHFVKFNVSMVLVSCCVKKDVCFLRDSCFINTICIYLLMLVSNTSSISDDVRVV